jgi:uncharacterized protein YdiU (UPF0061 family)
MSAEDIPADARAHAMKQVNPIYIPRNHLVDAALKEAAEGNMEPFDRLLTILSAPFTEQPGAIDYAEPAPADFGKFVTYCGT